MALKYTTLASLNAYLGTSGMDALVTQVGEGAEALIDTLIGGGLETSSRTAYFNPGYNYSTCNEGRIFYIPANNITAITTVNGVSAGTLNVNYTIDLQKVEFDNVYALPTTFPYRWAIAYTAGYATIPADIILAVNTLAGAVYTTKNANGIASFRQDLLSVNYKDSSILDTISDPNTKGFIQTIVNKYKIHTVLS